MPVPGPGACQTGPVSFLFGAGRDTRDPELVAANRRARLAFARDIGDEQTLARQDESPRYRRPSLWLFVFVVVVAAIGLLRAVNHHGKSVPIGRSCTTPGLALAASSAIAGSDLDWSATGPAAGRFVVVADGRPTSADPQGKVTATGGRALTPLFPMSDCVTHSTLVAPEATGSHVLRLYRRTDSGFDLVASRPLTVR